MKEYFARERMAKLGYTTNFNELDEATANIFMLISSELDKEQNRQAKRKK